MTSGTVHVHDSFQCPEHVRGCDCPDLDAFLCNPYWVRGHCPDELLLMPQDDLAGQRDA